MHENWLEDSSHWPAKFTFVFSFYLDENFYILPTQSSKIYLYFRTLKWLILLYSSFLYLILFCIVSSFSPELSSCHCIGGPSLLKQPTEITQIHGPLIVKCSTNKSRRKQALVASAVFVGMNVEGFSPCLGGRQHIRWHQWPLETWRWCKKLSGKIKMVKPRGKRWHFASCPPYWKMHSLQT